MNETVYSSIPTDVVPVPNDPEPPAKDPGVPGPYSDDEPVSEGAVALAMAKEHRLAFERLSEDFMQLVAAVQYMNNYQVRIQRVQEICAAILAPDPALVKANESMADVRGGIRATGRIDIITAEWDAKYQFNFTFRGTNGYLSGINGFDLRTKTPGLKALRETLIDVLNLPVDELNLDAPETPATGQVVARRLIYARKQEVTP